MLQFVHNKDNDVDNKPYKYYVTCSIKKKTKEKKDWKKIRKKIMEYKGLYIKQNYDYKY